MKLQGWPLDHIGIAVESIDVGKKFYETLGFELSHVEIVPTESVKVGFMALANGGNIELLEPTSEQSAVAKFIAKRGPGIHHICFRVQNLAQILADLKKQGVQLINSEPVPGAHSCQVAFVHPKATGGVLIELSEPRGDKK